jgi:hypothetical protein
MANKFHQYQHNEQSPATSDIYLELFEDDQYLVDLEDILPKTKDIIVFVSIFQTYLSQ